MSELKLKAHWYQNQAFDGDKSEWILEDSWGSYMQLSEEVEGVDVSMNYAEIDQLNDGWFHAEVGDCGMYGGPKHEGLAKTLEDAMELANSMFSHMVGFPVVESKLGTIDGGDL